MALLSLKLIGNDRSCEARDISKAKSGTVDASQTMLDGIQQQCHPVHLKVTARILPQAAKMKKRLHHSGLS